MTGHAVRAEREDRVRADIFDDGLDARGALRGIHHVAGPIAVVQPHVFLDAQDDQACHELGLAHLPQVGRRPALLVPRPFFPSRGRHAHYASSRADAVRHEAGHQVGLVVGVRPHPQQRAEVAFALRFPLRHQCVLPREIGAKA